MPEQISPIGNSAAAGDLARHRQSIMAHMIPFYPNEQGSFDVARALIDSGIRYLEIQFPFSDPTADGPTIEAACTTALARGFTVDKGFEFVRSLKDACETSGVKIFVMAYASLVYARGIQRFVGDAEKLGVEGLIVPDLPFDSDEGLYAACRRVGIECVPVIVPGISNERMDMVTSLQPGYIYCALRSGITGFETKLNDSTAHFLADVTERTGGKAHLLGGFGIVEPSQVRALAPSVHAVVVGSALVRAAGASADKGEDSPYGAVRALCGSLVDA